MGTVWFDTGTGNAKTGSPVPEGPAAILVVIFSAHSKTNQLHKDGLIDKAIRNKSLQKGIHKASAEVVSCFFIEALNWN